MIFYFMLTGVLANEGFKWYAIFGISLALYIGLGIFDLIILELLTLEWFLWRWITFFTLMSGNIVCIAIGIDNAKNIEDDEITEWGLGYGMTIINEFLIFGLIDAFVSFALFKYFFNFYFFYLFFLITMKKDFFEF